MFIIYCLSQFIFYLFSLLTPDFVLSLPNSMEKELNPDDDSNEENHPFIVSTTTADYGGKKDILHINGVPMWNDDVYVTYSKMRDTTTTTTRKWGLFANRYLAEGNIILEYKGDLLRENKFTESIKRRGYAVIFSRKIILDQLRAGYKSPNYAIDAYPYVSVKPLKRIGGFAINSLTNSNVTIRELDETTSGGTDEWCVNDIEYYRLFMYTKRGISKDEEILWNYDFAHRSSHNDTPRSD